MKKIRIDYYRFKLRKGRAYVLLQKEFGKEAYCLPYHYVKKEESIVRAIQTIPMEDDGDLVLLDIAMNDRSLDMTGREWFPIKNLLDVSLSRNESFHVWHNILRFFLSRCPHEGESGNVRLAEKMLKEVRIRKAKKEYLDWLQRLLEGGVTALDAFVVSQPDPILVQKEMESMEHFQVYRPHDIPMCQLDGELLEEDGYSFLPPDLSVFGVETKPINFLLEEGEDLIEE